MPNRTSASFPVGPLTPPTSKARGHIQPPAPQFFRSTWPPFESSSSSSSSSSNNSSSSSSSSSRTF
ncbi:hypothetical protein T05_947 [Trichinella murrelli]|uniref:Uncharacterized protein n=1 Tax=Trichinella murrelli TaxID=144512 RepID=A0A0V0UD15_9BILA|nr:hypothetical protein T05_947 [Trichinella murrelli]